MIEVSLKTSSLFLVVIMLSMSANASSFDFNKVDSLAIEQVTLKTVT